MNITVDLNALLLALLILAGIVLLVFLTVAVANLIKTLKKANGMLDDVSVMTRVAAEKTTEIKPAIDDLSSAVAGFAAGVHGSESRISSLSSIAKAFTSLVSIIKNSRAE